MEQEQNQQAERPPAKKGRPEKFMRFDGTPEELAQALFARAKPPDPSRRIHNRPKSK